MRKANPRLPFALLSCLLTSPLLAQSTDASGGGNLFALALLVVVVLIAFVVIVQVADNLLRIEARRIGADKEGVNYSVFPSIREILTPKVPDYVNGYPTIVLDKGYNLPLEGEPAPAVTAARGVKRFALQPPNFLGIAPIPKLEVEIGESVKAGDPLFFDKKAPDIKYVAPVSGEVIAVNRGEKRAITEVVILADKEQTHRELTPPDPKKASREEIIEFLKGSGGWMLIKQRPYNVVAEPEEVPSNIFISTFDTGPLAPDLNLVVKGREKAFQQGLDILARLTEGKVHLGLSANGETPPAPAFVEAKNVEKHYFKGPHPAGNVGVQIHHIAPITPTQKVWTLGVQEVITLGNLWLEKRFDAERIVALTGSRMKEPRYVKTLIGANVGELLKNEVEGDKVRLISGDVLSGEKKDPENFLNFYDDQVTAIPEGDYYELFGWLLPSKARPSLSRTYPNFLFPDLKFEGDTNTHGERRAFVMTGQYERVLPMDIYLQHLMKAIMINDFERMEGLGIYELVEEDVALAEFACTSKQPLQRILRMGLDIMREQG